MSQAAEYHGYGVGRQVQGRIAKPLHVQMPSRFVLPTNFFLDT